MKFIEVTHKTTIINSGGRKVDANFVGPQGTWSIEEAGRLTISRKALFLYQGETFTDLALLPER